MSAAAPFQLTPAIVAAMQWTLAGVELAVLAWVIAWLGRGWRLGRLARPFRRHAVLGNEGSEEAAGESPARLVSAGGAAQPLADEPRPATRTPRAPLRTPRSLRAVATPARGTDAVPPQATKAAERAPAALHCPGCGTLLARGDGATRLVMRCAGCDRRVAVRRDGTRVVVTVEG